MTDYSIKLQYYILLVIQLIVWESKAVRPKMSTPTHHNLFSQFHVNNIKS